MKGAIIDTAREEALKRYALISPLLEVGLSAPESAERRCAVLLKEGVSERTLRRWVAAYRHEGFDGLLKHERSDKGINKSISEDVLAKAEEYRRELPRRSAGLICELLERDGHKVARSTLERALRVKGLSCKQLKNENKTAQPTRRFNRIGRNTLWQPDIKYAAYVQSPKEPKKKIRTYMLALIDDATRFVVHAEFYPNQKLPILEDSLRKAISRYGSPRNLYVDNGKIFVSRWLELACARLNIRHSRTPVYSPVSHGKIERFNRTVENFLAEYSLEKPGTLEDLNRLFSVWLSESYHNKPHSSLNGLTPAEAFTRDESPLRFHTLEALRDAFLHEAERVVDKTGCLKLDGTTYDAGADFMRKKVNIHFDPFDMASVQLWSRGKFVKLLSEVNPGEFNGNRRVPPEKEEAGGAGSRTLKMYEEKQREKFKKEMGAFQLGCEEKGK
jgi:transposase InsO family protein